MEDQDKLKQIKDLVEEKKIIFAPQDRLGPLKLWLDKIKKALNIKSWFISDESTFGDFCLDDKKLQELRNNLGVAVDHKDYLVDVAQRMKDAELLA